MKTLIWSFFAYFLGSIPTAYFFSRFIFRFDIRKKGTGNVGTFNFLRVTSSKGLSLLVLIIDVLKGYLALQISAFYLPEDYYVFPAIAVILGHVFPIWLKGKGGRGLATLAGVFLFIQPTAVGIWCLIFGLIYFATKRYIIAAMFALLLVNFFICFNWGFEIFLISSSTSTLVMLKYFPRIKDEIIKKQK